MAPEKIREVRERSGAPMSECKTALEEAGGDVDNALEVLQKRGTTRSVSSARIATEGLVQSYIHTGGKLAVLVEVNCETDFVARTNEFKAFCEDIAMQIAGMEPKFVSREEIPADVLAKQQDIFMAAHKDAPRWSDEKKKGSRDPERLAKIIEGKIAKWYREVCLLDQDSIHVPGKTVEQLRTEVSAKFREKITIRRFLRWEVGEGLVRKTSNLAEEVAKAIGGDEPVPGLRAGNIHGTLGAIAAATGDTVK